MWYLCSCRAALMHLLSQILESLRHWNEMNCYYCLFSVTDQALTQTLTLHLDWTNSKMFIGMAKLALCFRLHVWISLTSPLIWLALNWTCPGRGSTSGWLCLLFAATLSFSVDRLQTQLQWQACTWVSKDGNMMKGQVYKWTFSCVLYSSVTVLFAAMCLWMRPNDLCLCVSGNVSGRSGWAWRANSKSIFLSLNFLCFPPPPPHRNRCRFSWQPLGKEKPIELPFTHSLFVCTTRKFEF